MNCVECGRETGVVLIRTAGVLILRVVNQPHVPGTITLLDEGYCEGFVTRRGPERKKLVSREYEEIFPR